MPLKIHFVCFDFLKKGKIIQVQGGDPKKPWNYLLEGRPLVVQASPPR